MCAQFSQYWIFDNGLQARTLENWRRRMLWYNYVEMPRHFYWRKVGGLRNFPRSRAENYWIYEYSLAWREIGTDSLNLSGGCFRVLPSHPSYGAHSWIIVNKQLVLITLSQDTAFLSMGQIVHSLRLNALKPKGIPLLRNISRSTKLKDTWPWLHCQRI